MEQSERRGITMRPRKFLSETKRRQNARSNLAWWK
jgi:hypothetical protein